MLLRQLEPSPTHNPCSTTHFCPSPAPWAQDPPRLGEHQGPEDEARLAKALGGAAANQKKTTVRGDTLRRQRDQDQPRFAIDTVLFSALPEY